ncbi:ribosomal protein S18-alanine N-acetyltransferase [Acidicapsa dinghuensis]|uniref:Ribosomal protein S18-alanine N-acetyltransferase n=1 Tax=Acidicapsa dinghuensis TaxID=2218256 RepID=A0ABW1EF93_9BACT|nr:ribosomal protein S18-alanine N-acetyltransferase [Acidicapsa dinghuensis]
MIGASSSMPEPISRPMTASDIDRVMDIAAQLTMAPHWSRESYEKALAQDAPMQRLARVAEIQGRIEGFAIANIIAGEAELESIAVAPTFQRRGVAANLLRSLIADLRSSRVGRLILEVRASNAGAQRLYAIAGFEQTGLRRGYYHSPDEDALIFELRIS